MRSKSSARVYAPPKSFTPRAHTVAPGIGNSSYYDQDPQYFSLMQPAVEQHPSSIRNPYEVPPQINPLPMSLRPGGTPSYDVTRAGVDRRMYQQTNATLHESLNGHPMNRYGRAGAPWRHVKRTTGHCGNNVMFVDGTVKIEDTFMCPPWDTEPKNPYHPETRLPYFQAPPYPNSPKPPKSYRRYNNIFQEHARTGFQYWHQDRKPQYSRKLTAGATGIPLGLRV